MRCWGYINFNNLPVAPVPTGQLAQKCDLERTIEEARNTTEQLQHRLSKLEKTIESNR